MGVRCRCCRLSDRPTDLAATLVDSIEIQSEFEAAMEPVFAEKVEGHGSILRCCRCGERHLHHDEVDIFARSEDAVSGLHVNVQNTQVAIDTSLNGNPSSRRHGLSILFWCEICHARQVLTVAQHKGQTFVNLIDTGSEMPSTG